MAAGLTLGACGGRPGAETMEAPGYPWTTAREELTASLTEQGLPYTEEENLSLIHISSSLSSSIPMMAMISCSSL